MFDKNETKAVEEYFEVNANAWLEDAYKEGGYNYPTPKHRLRVLKQIINDRKDINSLIDVGCGGGEVAIELAKMGLSIIGVDQSKPMLEKAIENLSRQDSLTKSRVSFEENTIKDIDYSDFDAVTAMGVIGYFDSDDVLFEIVSRQLRQGGYFIVSFRNRLFNLFSISNRTLNEVNTNSFSDLVQEVESLYSSIDKESFNQVIKNLHLITGELLTSENMKSLSEDSPSKQAKKEYSTAIEARQSTPQQAVTTASKYNFSVEKIYGIHPHLMIPSINNAISPQVYNRLCDGLIPLEEKPVSLIWSSVFIAVFKKN